MDEVDGMAGNEDRGGMQVGVLLPYLFLKQIEGLLTPAVNVKVYRTDEYRKNVF